MNTTLIIKEERKKRLLSDKELDRINLLYPLEKAQYFPYIEGELREKNSAINNYGDKMDDEILKYISLIQEMDYVGTYDYENGFILDFYEDNVYFIEVLKEIDSRTNIKAIFVYSVANKCIMWYNKCVK